MAYIKNSIKIYQTKKELYDDVLTSEKDKTIIPFPLYSEETGELLGFIKEYVD